MRQRKKRFGDIDDSELTPAQRARRQFWQHEAYLALCRGNNKRLKEIFDKEAKENAERKLINAKPNTEDKS